MNFCRRCSNPTRCAPWRGVTLCASCRDSVSRQFAWYRRYALSLVGACLSVLAGCSGNEISLTPDLYVDSDFATSSQTLSFAGLTIEIPEMQYVSQAIDAWESATPARFRVVLVSHEEAGRIAGSTQGPMGTPNTMVLVRMRSKSDPTCPSSAFLGDPGNQQQLAGDATADTTRNFVTGSSYTCVSAPFLLSVIAAEGDASGYTSTITHEIGHAFGLVHHPDCGACAMYPYTAMQQTPALACDDLVQFARLTGEAIDPRAPGPCHAEEPSGGPRKSSSISYSKTAR